MERCQKDLCRYFRQARPGCYFKGGPDEMGCIDSGEFACELYGVIDDPDRMWCGETEPCGDCRNYNCVHDCPRKEDYDERYATGNLDRDFRPVSKS